MLAHFYHAFIGLIGLLLLYAGLFLTETEEGKLQNRLEELWIRVDDFQSKALNRQAALLRQVSRLSADGMTRIFGQKLLSLKSVASCLCFAVSSVFLAIGFFAPQAEPFPSWLTLTGGIIFGLLGFSQILRYAGVALVMLSIITTLGYAFFVPPAESVGISIFSTLGIMVGALAMICSVALTRWSLGLASKTSNPATIFAVVLANIVLAVSLVGPMLVGVFADRIFPRWPGLAKHLVVRWRHMDFVFGASGTTLFAAALALVVVLVLLSALLHRIVWPAISRTIYAAHRYGLVKPKWFRKLGIACLIFSWPNNFLVKGIVKALQWAGLSM